MKIPSRVLDAVEYGEPSATNLLLGALGVVGLFDIYDNKNNSQSISERGLSFLTAGSLAVSGLGNFALGLGTSLRHPQEILSLPERFLGFGKPPSLPRAILVTGIGYLLQEDWRAPMHTIEDRYEREDDILSDIAMMIALLAPYIIPTTRSTWKGVRKGLGVILG